MVPVTVLPDLPSLYGIMFNTPHIMDILSTVISIEQQLERIRVNMNLDINIDMI